MTTGFGAFGKIPAMGDFLRLNLPAGFVQTWDSWMQHSMLSAQEALGAAWPDHYLSAPIWRFTLPAEQAGQAAMSGIVMASVDRVGRQYPLTLAAPHPAGQTAMMHFANRPVFEQLETLALQVLEHDLDRDALAEALSGIHAQTVAETGPVGASYAGPLPAETVLAAQSLAPRLGARGLWSTTMDGDSRMILCSSLPNPQEFLALFNLDAAIWRNSSMAQHA